MKMTGKKILRFLYWLNMLLKFRVATEWLEMIYYFPNSEKKKKKGVKTYEKTRRKSKKMSSK